MEQYPFPDRVTLCEDGQYRWSYVLTPEQGRFYYRQLLRYCAVIGGMIALIMLGVMYDMLGSAWWSILLFLGLMIGMPALVGLLIINGGEVRRYEMDQEHLRHKHATKGGDAWICFRKIREMSVEGDIFIIKEGITTYRIHVPAEDVAFVKRYIEDHM